MGYTIAYPSGHRPGAALPLVVMLHAFGGNLAHALSGMSSAQAVALKTGGRPLAPEGDGHRGQRERVLEPHPGDDPMAMIIGELIPRCQRLGPGRPPRRIGAMGVSMGGYGALLAAEKYPRLFAAAAAISPAIWISYAQARAVNPGAHASAVAFAASDAVTTRPRWPASRSGWPRETTTRSTLASKRWPAPCHKEPSRSSPGAATPGPSSSPRTRPSSLAFLARQLAP